jgi:hypothetical protein
LVSGVVTFCLLIAVTISPIAVLLWGKMRIQLGGLPKKTADQEDPNAGKLIRQPGQRASAILAGLGGLGLLLVSTALTIAAVSLLSNLKVTGFSSKEFIPSLGILIIILLTIIAHELSHALLHPGFGFTDSTVLFLDWKKLQFGVYYEGRIPRRRWIAMRLFPLFVLTVLPLAVFLVLFFQASSIWDTFLIIMILTNSVGSGGDLAAVIIVMRQVPPDGELNFYRGKAYWLPAGRESDSASDREEENSKNWLR